LDLKKDLKGVYKQVEMEERNQYYALAKLFQYPTEGYIENVNACVGLLKEHYPEAAVEIAPFAALVNENSLDAIEEIFTRTFHIQAICYLDLGYVLFGEDYKRGEFLVNMKLEQRKVNHDCGEELPDNLANVLILMAKTEEQEFLNELGARIVIPSLGKMLQEYDAARIELKTKVMRKKHRAILQENLKGGIIYKHPLRALLTVLQHDFKGIEYEVYNAMPSIGGDVLSNCVSCSVPSTNATTT